MNRVVDIVLSGIGLAFVSPILLPICFLIWAQDFKSPFYIAPRVGRAKVLFSMVKVRSMVAGADKTGVQSTSADDMRITNIGKFVRKYKLDELAQLWNVFKGDMALVGPRPNTETETFLYTKAEARLLEVRPGITDFASIVFSDEGEILKGSHNPDLDYNRLIRPWKSRLGLFYIENRSVLIDLQLIVLTVLAIFSKKAALKRVTNLLRSLGADEKLLAMSERKNPLVPTPPPGSSKIVTER